MSTSRVIPKLTRDAIGRAALAMFRKEGELRTPQLARELGVSSPAFYKHVSGRAEIVELARGALYAEMHMPEPAETLAEYVPEVLKTIAAAYASAPSLAAQPVQNPSLHRGPFDMHEHFAAGLLHSGVPAQAVVDSMRFIDSLAIGLAIKQAIDNTEVGRVLLAPPWREDTEVELYPVQRRIYALGPSATGEDFVILAATKGLQAMIASAHPGQAL